MLGFTLNRTATVVLAGASVCAVVPVTLTAGTASRRSPGTPVSLAPRQGSQQAPSDTVKNDRKSRQERAPSAQRRRPARSRGGSPGGSPGNSSGGAGVADPRLLPDQPWETEFYVDNSLLAQPRGYAWLTDWRFR